jgi:cyclopropane fatty-acyl-phospholipid synthase-like methyltransferase
MQSWIDYWNLDTSIYVNMRHKQLHYQSIAADTCGLMLASDHFVLDYGCGEALCADEIAKRCTCLYLCDGAETVRSKLKNRFLDVPRIKIIEPFDFKNIENNSLDLIIMNSVLQYLGKDEFSILLKTCASKLKAEGKLILADIISPSSSALEDVYALLQFAFKGGFLFAAITGLIRTYLSDYRKIRSDLGLSSYTESDINAILGEHGFTARRLLKNIGHNQKRMCFEAFKILA